MKPREKAVFALVERAATSGMTCPTNNELAEVAGISSVGSASEILSRLQQQGLISIERGQCSRVVTILETGKRTAGVVSGPHWRDQSGRTSAPCKPRQKEDRTIIALRAAEREQAIADLPRHDRDPCSYCGVRGDIGCHHRQAAA
jgi:hypothetical protein